MFLIKTSFLQAVFKLMSSLEIDFENNKLNEGLIGNFTLLVIFIAEKSLDKTIIMLRDFH